MIPNRATHHKYVALFLRVFFVQWVRVIRWTAILRYSEKPRKLLGKASFSEWFFNLNSLSASPTKWSSRLKQFVGYCRRIVWVWPRMLKSLAKLSNNLGVTDHFVGLALRGLKGCILSQRFTRNFFKNFHNAWPSRYLSVESQQSKHQKNVWIILCSKLTIKTP